MRTLLWTVTTCGLILSGITGRLAAADRLVYVANYDTGCITAFAMDQATGALAEILGSPFLNTGYAWSVAVDLKGKFVYVADVISSSGSPGDGVSGFSINAATGSLTAISGSPFLAADDPWSVAVTPNGSFAYVPATPGLSGYSIDSTTGVLTPVSGSPYPGADSGFSAWVEPHGKFLYVAGCAGGVCGYRINASTGSLTSIVGSPYPAGVGPYAITVNSKGQFAYVTSLFDNNIWAFTLNSTTGALTAIAGSPFFSMLTGPDAIAISPNGKFAYVADEAGDVAGFTIDATTGALTPIPGSPFPAYKTRGTAQISGQRRERLASTKDTESIPISAANSVAVDRTGSFVYSADHSSNTVLGYAIDSATGALTAIAGSPFPAGGASSIAFGPQVSKATEPADNILYNFQSGDDGANPVASLAMGAKGVLYGTTNSGGSASGGTVFSLSPPATSGGQWTETILHTFTSSPADGAYPESGVVIAGNGTLYGTAYEGGAYGFGMVYSLTPPAASGDQWTETVLYNFKSGPNDGAYPYGGLARNSNGVFYGTTEYGGGLGGCQSGGCGTVFSLIPPKSPGGNWKEEILWSFSGGMSDGAAPLADVVLGNGGVLYGTTFNGLYGGDCTDESGCGGVFQLTPPTTSGGKWTEAILTGFGANDFGQPYAGVLVGPGGVLYGTTLYNVYSLTPPPVSGEGWSFCPISDVQGGYGGVAIDASGVLYAGLRGGLGYGTIASLTPPPGPGCGRWAYTDLWDFQGAPIDGDDPFGAIVMSSSGVLYGTTQYGGNGSCPSPPAQGCGTVFALKP